MDELTLFNCLIAIRNTTTDESTRTKLNSLILARWGKPVDAPDTSVNYEGPYDYGSQER